MDLADEKIILRDIQSTLKTKSQLEQYHLYERLVQEKKGQLTDLREALKLTGTAIDELEAALGKVKLATKLQCTASELQTLSVDIPADKIGRVIGKNGSTIKQIESLANVAMDVDSVACKIHLTGSAARLAIAISEIDKISLAQDTIVPVPNDVLVYFTTKVRLCFIDALYFVF
jgi:predicted RNA-binding protein YlqC (UPF0109 family)